MKLNLKQKLLLCATVFTHLDEKLFDNTEHRPESRGVLGHILDAPPDKHFAVKPKDTPRHHTVPHPYTWWRRVMEDIPKDSGLEQFLIDYRWGKVDNTAQGARARFYFAASLDNPIEYFWDMKRNDMFRKSIYSSWR